MSDPFKPGDIVRPSATFVVAEVKDTGLLRVEKNEAGLLYAEPDLVELVEPSIPISKLREVCQDVQSEDCFFGLYAVGRKEAAEWILKQLIGEST